MTGPGGADGGRPGSARRLERLRARLGRLLPARGKVAPPRGGEREMREPAAEGALLVWRDRFLEAGWLEGEGPRLFGPSRRPSLFAGACAEKGLDGERLVFVDIETCGLAHCPVFLVGTLSFRAGRWELVQRLAPDPSAEPELLERAAALLGEKPHWVSYNGRSFDIPRIRARSRLHGIDWPAAAGHEDLLHAVRRRWRKVLPDCRLATVESRLLGLERSPRDVPGREVPERYQDFVRSGDRRWIAPVVEHNRRDVAALGALFLALGDGGRGPEAAIAGIPPVARP